MELELPKVNSFRPLSFLSASPWLLTVTKTLCVKKCVLYFYALKHEKNNNYKKKKKTQQNQYQSWRLSYSSRIARFRYLWGQYSSMSTFKYDHWPVMSMNSCVAMYLKPFVPFNLPELFYKDFPWQSPTKETMAFP